MALAGTTVAAAMPAFLKNERRPRILPVIGLDPDLPGDEDCDGEVTSFGGIGVFI